MHNTHLHHQRACSNKKKYATRQDAQARASILWDKGIQLKAYRCPICGGWHLTSIRKSTKVEAAFAELDRSRQKAKAALAR